MGPGAVHVDRFGHGGPPIVLLHGFGTSTFLWRAVGPALVHAGYTAFAIDLLGHGESDRPLDADFGVAAQSEYVDRAMTALRVSRAVVVGVDVGGAVALRLAATRPERVARLVLVNSGGGAELPGEDIRSLQRNTARFALRVSRGVLGAAPLLIPLLEGSVAEPTHMPQRLLARYLAPFAGGDGVRHLLALARAIRDDEEEIDLASVATPTLVVWGDADRWLDERTPERLVAALPDARIERVAGVGRLVPEEAPERLVEHIIAAAKRREPAGVVQVPPARDPDAVLEANFD